MSLNRVTLIGRLTRDPDHRTTPTGRSVASFGLAVRKRFKPQNPDERDADFFNIKVWGQTADYAKNYLNKGRLVAVDGRLESRKYTDSNGVNREVVEVVADNVSALDGPRDDGGAGGGVSGADRGGSTPPSEVEYDPFADD